MKRTVFSIVAAAIIMSMPLPASAVSRSEIYEPSWQKIEVPEDFTISLDVKSIVREKDTGIVSFFIEKTYDEKDVQDGEIMKITSRIDYNPLGKMYRILSREYVRKNKNATADVDVYSDPPWEQIAHGSYVEVVCQEAADYLQKNQSPENGRSKVDV